MRQSSFLVLVVFVVLSAACGGTANRVGGSPADPLAVLFPVSFDPANFDGRPVDNPFFPLEPGKKLIYEAQTDEGLERVEVLTTNQRRPVAGVDCVIVHAVAYLDGEVIEDTLDWFAQDVEGNVWYMGEDSKDIEDGVIVSTEGSWEAGVDGARAGIIMFANPAVGGAYAQEQYTGVAEDRGKVVGTSALATVPFGSFVSCVQTEDWTPLEPGVVENKFYASGLGVVLEVGSEGTRLELISVECNPIFDAADFVTSVANPLFPLPVGRRWTYQADTDEGVEEVVVEVLAQTRMILGVSCVVVRDTVRLDGDLVEETDDWFATDRYGNVWYMGEDSKDYENGVLVSTAGSWEAGVQGAQPGIIMWASPRVGVTYRQEHALGEAEDMATVRALAEAVSVPTGGYTQCLRTEEFTPLEPGISEQKYYAPGVGFVLGIDDEGVRLELVRVE